MTKDVENIFHQAIEIASIAERNSFLDSSCSGSPELRKQVEDLLSAFENAGTFQERSAKLSKTESIANPPDVSEFLEPDPAQTLPPKKPAANTSIRMGSELPRRFGDYELLEKIAQGGMGVVYKARQVSLNRTVAVKMILAGQFANDEEVMRFQVEAEAAAHIDHPGIVPVFDVGCYDGNHFFSMGYVKGKSLAHKIKEGAMPFRQAALLVRKISLAMQAAHERGVVHRDLKPGNVLLDKNDEPRVTDFGLAKRVEGDSKLTTTGMVMGTPSYMPPEQAAGKQINSSADIYSLGAILYALLTGKPPFEGDGQIETLIQVIHNEPIAPCKQVPAIPKDLEAICLKCLEKKAEDRYLSAAELADDLQRFLAGEPISAKNDLKRRFRKWTIREPVLAAQLAATLALMLVILFNYLILGAIGDQANNFRLFLIYEAILLATAVSAFLLQKIHNRLNNQHVVPVIWAAMNPLFVTGALCFSDEPRGLLFSLYLLLMITICFFRRVDLVAVTTISSVIGYGLIMIFLPEPNVSHQITFALTLIVGGVLLSFLAVRMKRLSQKDTA